MAEETLPFDTTPAASEIQWSRMARLWQMDGVDGTATGVALKVTAGGGLNVNIGDGRAYVAGFLYRNTATETRGLAINNTTNPRIDRVVVRVNTLTNTGTVFVISGTPAASPQPPALTYTDSIFDLPLADCRVEANDTISTISDRRPFIGRTTVDCLSTNRPDPKGRPLLAFERDTDRIIYANGDGNWVVGMGADIFRPLYTYADDFGTTTSAGSWMDDVFGSSTPIVSRSWVAPPSGRSMVRIGANLGNNHATAFTYMAVRVRASTGVDYWTIRNNPAAGQSIADRMIYVKNSAFASCSASYYASSLTPGMQYTATLMYRVETGTGYYDDRFLEIDPLP